MGETGTRRGIPPYDPARRVGRLVKAVNQSRRDLEIFRKQRLRVFEQYTGIHYGIDNAPDAVPINLINLYANIFRFKLVAHNPEVLMSTERDDLESFAKTFELTVNKDIKRLKLEKALGASVLSALLGPLGIVKVATGDGGTVDIDGETLQASEIFALEVLFDDWVHDTTATRYEGVNFAGDRFRVSFDWAKENREFDSRARDRMSAVEQTARNPASEGSDRRAEAISHGEKPRRDGYQEEIELWSLWIPPEKRVAIMWLDGAEEDSELQSIDWTGPEHGPYHLLGFGEVPGNVMPLAPACNWFDAHDLTNKLFRKAARQAEAQKSVMAVKRGAEEDADRLVGTADGGYVAVDGMPAQDFYEHKSGGADPRTIAMYLQAKREASYVAGNMDLLGGLSPQSPTLGQDEMLMRTSSGAVVDMNQRFISFTQGIVEDIALYRWQDPLSDVQVRKPIGGFEGLAVDALFNAAMLEGEFPDYALSILPYSMQDQSPEARLQKILMLLREFIQPMIPMMQEQGMVLDVEKVVRTMDHYSGLRGDLEDWVVFSQPSPETAHASQAGAGKPAVTRRTYERVNRPGATAGGQDQFLAQHLLGGGEQQSQLASLMRGAG